MGRAPRITEDFQGGGGSGAHRRAEEQGQGDESYGRYDDLGREHVTWVLYAAPKLVPYVSQKIAADADRSLGMLAYLGRHLSAFLLGHLEGPLARGWPVALLLLLPLLIGSVLFMSRRARVAEYQGRNHSHTLTRSHAHSSAPFLATVLLTALVLGWLISLRAPFFPARGERLLEAAMPEGAFVLGVDSHTALVLDLDAGVASVTGLGGVTVRVGGRSAVFPGGSEVAVDAFGEAARELAAGLEVDVEREFVRQDADAGVVYAGRVESAQAELARRGLSR